MKLFTENKEQQKKIKPIRLTSIDLFAGCGGLSLGLEQAGFTPIFANELNGTALETYIENRRKDYEYLANKKFHCNDVKSMIIKKEYIDNLIKLFKDNFGIENGDLDLVAGGPPCQGFSGIGHRRSYAVAKEQLPSNHLYQDMAHIVHRLRPKVFLFENVRGLLNSKWNDSGKKGEIFEDVMQTFRDIDEYRIGWSLVYSKNYGVPQNRPRVLIVGIRNDIHVNGESNDEIDGVKKGFLPKVNVNIFPPTIEELFSDILDVDYKNGGQTYLYPMNHLNVYQETLRTNQDNKTVKEKGAILTEHKYTNHGPTVVAKYLAMLADKKHRIPEQFKTKKFAQKVLPKVWGPNGPTITATSLPEDYVHYVQPRILTVREWARLQMFPDWYQFAGKRTTGGLRRAGNPREGLFEREVPKYTQIGNAVPVKLAFEVGFHLANILRNQ